MIGHVLAAITRDISPAMASCELTHLPRTPIDLDRARAQHRDYERALAEAGCRVERLPAGPDMPDAVFVEDIAIVLDELAIITRPGAESRRVEVPALAAALEPHRRLRFIAAPGTVDGGDVCQIGEHFLIGVSHRTNESGARQLQRRLAAMGYGSELVDIRHHPELLHLKSGLSWLDGETVAATRSIAGHAALARYRALVPESREAYAANCVRVNDDVLFAAGYPKLEAELKHLGLRPCVLEMSEFRKMDGGLSCLSLRF